MKDLVIIFDLDGTLLYTDELIHHCFEHVFHIYKPGYTLSNEEHLSFLGPSLKSTLERYFDSNIDEMIQCFSDYSVSHHKDYVTIYPSVKETLIKLKEMGCLLAIFTTKHSREAYTGLDLFEITDLFDCIVCGDDVKHHKPNPTGIYDIMKQLDCHNAIMVGDNTSDIQAGINAGIETVGVSWSPKKKQLEEINPTLMINQMDELIPYIERKVSK